MCKMNKSFLKSLLVLIFFSFSLNVFGSAPPHDPLLNDFVSNGGEFTPDFHSVNWRETTNSSRIVINYFDWPMNGHPKIAPLSWSYVQPKLVDSNTDQTVAMDSFKRSMSLWSKTMIFHLFAVPKVLIGFSAEDKKMIETKWGLEFPDPSAKPNNGDYVELIYKKQDQLHTIQVNHKMIKSQGSMNAYFRHKGFNFSPPKVEFQFTNKISFMGRLSKDQIFNEVFNLLSNDYYYGLSSNSHYSSFNNVSCEGNLLDCIKDNISTFKEDWKRIYNYTLGKRSPHFTRENVIAGHKAFAKIVSANKVRKKEEAKLAEKTFFAENYKIVFNSEGCCAGSTIDGKSYHHVAGILIPDSIFKLNLEKGKWEVRIKKSDTFYKIHVVKTFFGMPKARAKGESLTGEEVYSHFKKNLKGFEDLSDSLSQANNLEGDSQGNQKTAGAESLSSNQGQQAQLSQDTTSNQENSVGGTTQAQTQQQQTQQAQAQQAQTQQAQAQQAQTQQAQTQQAQTQQAQAQQAQTQQAQAQQQQAQQSSQPTVQQQLEQMIQQQAQQTSQEVQQLAENLETTSVSAEALQAETVSTEQLQTESSSTESLNQKETKEEPKSYVFSFVKTGNFGGKMFGAKFYADIEGLYVLYDDIKSLIGRVNTYKLEVSNEEVFYKVKHVQGKGYVKGEKLRGTEAFNYLKAKLSSKKEYNFKQY